MENKKHLLYSFVDIWFYVDMIPIYFKANDLLKKDFLTIRTKLAVVTNLNVFRIFSHKFVCYKIIL